MKEGIGGNEGRHLREHLIEFHHPCQTNGFVSTDLSSNLQNKDSRGEQVHMFFEKKKRLTDKSQESVYIQYIKSVCT